MTPDWAAKLIEFLRLPTKLVAVICLVSALLTFLSPDDLSKLHLDSLQKEYAPILGIVFLVSAILLVLEAVIWVYSILMLLWNRYRLSNRAVGLMDELDTKEIAVLREFFIQGQFTLQLPMDHPVVAGLLRKGILFFVGEIGSGSLAGILVPMSISEPVKKRITYEYLGLPEGEPTESEIEWVRRNRPEFMGELDRRQRLHYGFGNNW